MAGIINMASQGRGGDTMMAHMTPGEMVIPKEVAALRPDLVAHVQEGIRRMGGDASKYVAGNGRINPQTGAEEFATQDEITQAYQTQLGRAPDAAGLAYWQANPEGFNGGHGGAFEQGVVQELNSRQPAPAAPAAPNPTPAVAQGYTAAQQAPAVSSPITQRTIDPDKETTAGQINGIINENSPLMQQASARAMQAANDRGLGNSSLAVGAAQGALYNAAMPIANADAGIYGNAATLNTNTQNQFTATKDQTQNQINTNNTGAINTASAFGSGAANQASLQNAQTGSSERNAQLAAATQKTIAANQTASQQTIAANNAASAQIIAGLNNDSQMAIKKVGDTNAEILQTDASASSLHAQAMQTIAGIQQNPNVTDKQGAINQVLATLNNSLSVMGIIGKDLDFSTIPAASTPTTTPSVAAPPPIQREGN